MSEYWVSQGKFYCKYCKVYIADDKPSRSHHDTGFRHKGNLERYIRDIYKKGNKQEREKAEEARQIAAIDAAAAAAMGISAEQASTSGSAPPSFRKRKAASSSSGPSYTTAADLGFTDPEAERLQKEKELREKEGILGEWSFVAPVAGPSRTRSTSADQHDEHDEEEPATDEPPKEEREEPDHRRVTHSSFKEKSLPVLDDDDYDTIKIKVRTPRQTTDIKDALAKARDQARTQAPVSENARQHQVANGKMKFKAVELTEYEETPEEQEERYKAALELIEPKTEGDDDGPRRSTIGAPMFKRRKAKAGDAGTDNKRRG